ncbi:hypothetical protein V1517DRAFT_337531 [Lipomyces orientalis]|uniref:Uncharacterized protein n=1 Tax=Lipomyces orientalis TaxID=1233043 RepID=A0ACC3TS48_9ASCO
MSSIVVNFLTNYQLNPTAWNWGAKTDYFWADICLSGRYKTISFYQNPKAAYQFDSTKVPREIHEDNTLDKD